MYENYNVRRDRAVMKGWPNALSSWQHMALEGL